MNSQTLSDFMCIGILFPWINPEIGLARWLEAGLPIRHLKGQRTPYKSRIEDRK